MTIDIERKETGEAKAKKIDPQAVKPQFFKLNPQMLSKGRTNTELCRTEDGNQWGVVKVYASGGENGLHTHTSQHHIFLVMQGSARFYGPEGESHECGTHEGVLLPAGAFYWFEATSEEPLVLFRVGGRADDGDIKERLNVRGEPMPGEHPDNKQVEVIYKDGEYFE
jgi:mannose-6-phosphate isomerase-like protein (cupin superfamily)